MLDNITACPDGRQHPGINAGAGLPPDREKITGKDKKSMNTYLKELLFQAMLDGLNAKKDEARASYAEAVKRNLITESEYNEAKRAIALEYVKAINAIDGYFQGV